MGEVMAEVRKKVVEDRYDSSKIKNKKITKDSKNVNIKEKSSKSSEKNEKLSFLDKFKSFCHGVKLEFQRVHWTSKKDMIKYSVACIIFIVFCSLFFYVIDVLFALVRSMFS